MEIEYCKFLSRVNKDGTIEIKPLGVAKNEITQSMVSRWDNVVTEIVIDKNYTKGLDGIEDYSHVIVIYWFDKEGECHIKHHPQGNKNAPFVGIFACRCPQRPNPIGISTVKLVERKGNVIKVKGLDILNGTPILDIKPYSPQYDEVKRYKVPDWIYKLKY